MIDPGDVEARNVMRCAFYACCACVPGTYRMTSPPPAATNSSRRGTPRSCRSQARMTRTSGTVEAKSGHERAPIRNLIPVGKIVFGEQPCPSSPHSTCMAGTSPAMQGRRSNVTGICSKVSCAARESHPPTWERTPPIRVCRCCRPAWSRWALLPCQATSGADWPSACGWDSGYAVRP
jgi:hypothetical protein